MGKGDNRRTAKMRRKRSQRRFKNRKRRGLSPLRVKQAKKN